MKREDIDAFEKLKAQLGSLYDEMSLLAKKSPNGPLNEFKIKFVNATLHNCNKLLGPKYKPFPDFEIFPVDELPTNSDVTFILSQYIECAEKFRSDNIVERSYNDWFWELDDDDGDDDDDENRIRTTAPKRLSEK